MWTLTGVQALIVTSTWLPISKKTILQLNYVFQGLIYLVAFRIILTRLSVLERTKKSEGRILIHFHFLMPCPPNLPCFIPPPSYPGAKIHTNIIGSCCAVQKLLTTGWSLNFLKLNKSRNLRFSQTSHILSAQ